MNIILNITDFINKKKTIIDKINDLIIKYNLNLYNFKVDSKSRNADYKVCARNINDNIINKFIILVKRNIGLNIKLVNNDYLDGRYMIYFKLDY